MTAGMDKNAIERAAGALSRWTPPAADGGIPHGDMPGDKVEIGQGHIDKANVIFPLLLPLAAGAAARTGRVVVSVCGGSGVGKSETASLLSHYFRCAGVGAYTLSGDNYPRRIPMYNDAERVRIFRTGGIRGMLDAGVYTAAAGAALRDLWAAEADADPGAADGREWLRVYQAAGRQALAGYLGTPDEQDYDELNAIIAGFKAGRDRLWLKRMGRTEDERWYEEADLSRTGVLVIEWTHGGSDFLRGVDVLILLNSTPEETRAHRRSRARDGKTDSAFTTMVLEIEQAELDRCAHKAKIIISKSGEALTYGQYRALMDREG